MNLRRLLPLFLLLGGLFIVGPLLRAQTILWDINGATAGSGGATPDGTWDGTTPNWSGDVDGVIATTIWSSGAVAVFSAGTDATGSYTVTVSGTQTIGGLTVEEGTPTFSGGSLSFASTALFDITGDASFTTALTGAGSLTKAGTGFLHLDGINTYASGSTIKSGTVQVESGGSINHAAADFFVGDASGDDGTLALITGATVTSANGYIGHLTGSAGTVTIDGPGSAWTNGTSLAVGNLGYGSLILSSGGTVNVAGGAGTLTLGSGSTGSGYMVIGGDYMNPVAGGIINAATITTGTGTGTIDFFTDATVGSPYYLTNDGTSTGTAVAITGPTQVNINTGYTVLAGTNNTYTGETTLYGGTLADANANAFSPNSIVGLLGGSSFVVNFNETIGGLEDFDGTGPVTLASGATLTINDSADAYTEAPISGAGALAKTGTGVLTLAGASTYTGGTNITGGTLVYGATGAFGTGAIVVDGGKLAVATGVTFGESFGFGAGGGTLGGNGTFTSPLTLGADVILSPGNSPGTLTFAAGLTLTGSGGSSLIEISGATDNPGVSADLIAVTGTLNLAGLTGYTLNVISLLPDNLTAGPVSGLSATTSWTIFTSDTLTGFDVNDFTIDASGFVNAGTLSLAASGNNLLLTFTPVPEPSTYALMFAGLALAGMGYRRMNRMSRPS